MARILLVEDDVDVRMFIEHVLIDSGYEVDATGTEASGRDLLCRFVYDLVIADARLPDGSGLAVANDARESDSATLIVTGYAFTLPYEAFERHDILLKPFRSRELLDAVARHLGN